jgi:hypothetical protein
MPEMMVARLPPDTEVSGNGTGKISIIDEILINPGYTSGGFEPQAMLKIIESYEALSESILLPKWQSLGRRLGMGAEEQLRFFANLGFLAIDGAMMVRVGPQ